MDRDEPAIPQERMKRVTRGEQAFDRGQVIHRLRDRQGPASATIETHEPAVGADGERSVGRSHEASDDALGKPGPLVPRLPGKVHVGPQAGTATHRPDRRDRADLDRADDDSPQTAHGPLAIRPAS